MYIKKIISPETKRKVEQHFMVTKKNIVELLIIIYINH